MTMKVPIMEQVSCMHNHYGGAGLQALKSCLVTPIVMLQRLGGSIVNTPILGFTLQTKTIALLRGHWYP